MRPAATRRSAWPMLIFDHTPFGRRGVNRCRKHCASQPRFWPSSQPWHRATSSASASVTEAMPAAFFAIFNQARKSVGEGKSGAARVDLVGGCLYKNQQHKEEKKPTA